MAYARQDAVLLVLHARNDESDDRHGLSSILNHPAILTRINNIISRTRPGIYAIPDDGVLRCRVYVEPNGVVIVSVCDTTENRDSGVLNDPEASLLDFEYHDILKVKPDENGDLYLFELLGKNKFARLELSTAGRLSFYEENLAVIDANSREKS